MAMLSYANVRRTAYLLVILNIGFELPMSPGRYDKSHIRKNQICRMHEPSSKRLLCGRYSFLRGGGEIGANGYVRWGEA